MPKRLTELTDSYPYGQGSSSSDDDLLPRPRFSTRRYDALYVRLETEYTGVTKPKSHPLRIIAEALKSKGPEEGDQTLVWDAIRKASSGITEGESTEPGVYSFPVFARIFADETIRLLSLIPADSPEKSPTFALLTPTIRSLAEEVERDRGVPESVICSLAGLGVFRIAAGTPDPVLMADVFEEIGYADGSTGWCAMIGGATSMVLNHLAKDVADGMLADPHMLIAGVAAPQGRGVVAGGGLRVSGRWAFASAAKNATWLVGGVIVLIAMGLVLTSSRSPAQPPAQPHVHPQDA